MLEKSDKTVVESLSAVIRRRQTQKMIADEPTTGSIPATVIETMLSTAAFAPFHLAAAEEHRQRVDSNTLVPWRVCVLSKMACFDLRQYLLDSGDVTKVPNMLAAADGLLLVTWCPDPVSEDFQPNEDYLYEPTIQNMEHIAAGSAFIQNLLLLATAQGIGSYWSSGGALKTDAVFQQVGIPVDEILLGAIFLFPGCPDDGNIQVKTGKMRDRRGNVSDWCRWM